MNTTSTKQRKTGDTTLQRLLSTNAKASKFVALAALDKVMRKDICVTQYRVVCTGKGILPRNALQTIINDSKYTKIHAIPVEIIAIIVDYVYVHPSLTNMVTNSLSKVEQDNTKLMSRNFTFKDFVHCWFPAGIITTSDIFIGQKMEAMKIAIEEIINILVKKCWVTNMFLQKQRDGEPNTVSVILAGMCYQNEKNYLYMFRVLIDR